MHELTLDLSPVIELDDEALYRLCVANDDLRIERNANGQLIIMAPAGGETSNRNSYLAVRLGLWNERTGLGYVFESSGGFILGNKAMRAPDAAFVARARWEALPREARRRFPPLCPDFVIELMSPSDTLGPLQEKMEEWRANGCRLGWLIDPDGERAWVYHGDGATDEVPTFDEPLRGGDVLPGFELPLAPLRR